MNVKNFPPFSPNVFLHHKRMVWVLKNQLCQNLLLLFGFGLALCELWQNGRCTTVWSSDRWNLPHPHMVHVLAKAEVTSFCCLEYNGTLHIPLTKLRRILLQGIRRQNSNHKIFFWKSKLICFLKFYFIKNKN